MTAADVIVTIAIRTTTIYAITDPTDLPIFVTEVVVDTAAIKREKARAGKVADSTAISVAKVDANAAIVKRGKAPADYRALGVRTDIGADIDALANAHERITIPIIATDNEIINDEQGDIRRKGLVGSLIKNKYNLRNYVVQKSLFFS